MGPLPGGARSRRPPSGSASSAWKWPWPDSCARRGSWS